MHVTERKQLMAGIGLVVVGVIVAIVGGVLVHVAEADLVNEFGQEMFPGFPRGWIPATIAQTVSLGGVLMVLAGITLAFVYRRTLTWARAMIGALVFTALMFILFAIIPNQMLTIFQATLEWTPQKTFITVPAVLVLGNEVALSYAVIKDMIVAGYVTTMFIVIPVIMYQIQEHARRRREAGPKPEPLSNYGRPLRVGD
jgi:hypothetical protein